MIERSFVENNGSQVARVRFTFPDCSWADSVHLVGDFNDWNRTSHPFQLSSGGNWVLTMDFPCGHTYQFRYLIDGRDWVNDSQADSYVSNRFGSDNCVLVTDPAPSRKDIGG